MIKTKRLNITKFTPDMAMAVHLNSLDDDNRRFNANEVFETVEDARDTVLYLIGAYEREDSPLVYPILLNDGTNAGYVEAVPLCDGGWEIGYHIAKAHTCNGYATEAVSAFLPFIMKKLDIAEIFGICIAENIASIRVLEKAGFTKVFEGVGAYQGKETNVCRYVYKAKSEPKLEKMDEFFENRLSGYEEHMLSNIEGADEFYTFTAHSLPAFENCSILDLGCGTGLELERYFPLCNTARVTAIDLSQGMLDRLAEKFGDKEIIIRCGSYFDLPFGEEIFDGAVSVESLHHFTRSEKLGLYKKLFYALKRGGYFILTDYFANDDAEETLYFNELKRLKAEQGITDNEFYHYDTPLTVEHELQALTEAGFKAEVLSNWGATYTIKATRL